MNQEEQKKMEAEILNARRMIVEMIDASIELAAKKGKHSLKTGCSCIFFADFLQGLKIMIKLLKFFIIQDIKAIIHLIRNKQI